jgi:ferredoxin
VQPGTIAGLSELLCSGRPVHVLLLDRPLLRQAESPGRTHLEIGYLAVAHRDAFVLQSTLARPAHLLSGLASMARSGRPAVAVIAVPSAETGPAPALELEAALEGRATPRFLYDPDAGDTWAACFEFEDDPQPEEVWPVHELAYRDENGIEHKRTEAFTFAHAASLTPAFRRHFRLVRPEQWDESQVEIADYLLLAETERSRKVPFVWVVDDGELVRAVATYDLASVCRDRLKTRRMLRELAGVDSATRDALSPVDQPEPGVETIHSDELARVRQEAGQEAVARLVYALMDLGDAPAVAAAAVAPVAPGAAAEPTPTAVGEAAAEKGPAIVEPYIDSALCTTCDDCTKLNSRMFRYNENKQAYIADVTAGTFAELVKAAEKCPARCIHPGAPRKGDRSATEAMLKRAARFN